MGETRLFVGNVPAIASETDLRSEFSYYGVVGSVEIKQKHENENFAFVNIQIEERLIEKCIREFGQQQFKGNFLSVSKAKESFLERLKREREEAQRPPEPVVQNNNYKYQDETYNERYAPLPVIEKEVSSDESEEEEEVIPQAPVWKAPAKPATNGYSAHHYDAPIMDKAMIDDMKRQESLLKLKSIHDAQKLAIKNALLGIDSTVRNNKIVFEPPELPVEKEEEAIEVPVPSSKKRKAQLFDGEDEDEQEPTQENFKVKKQFAGKNGEKLFELQTRFQNDKRFEIDEKFAEDADDTFDARKRYTREELKERKKARKELENWDQNEMKQERDNQLSILEGITGQSTGLLDNGGRSRPAQKGMLRFDPSKKDHWKYLDLVKGEDAVEAMEVQHDNKTDDQFEVSEEKFYEVSDTLAQSLQQKSKPFSIFEMLGVNHEDEVEEEPKAEETKILTKLPTFNLSQAKFKYDSSDTDEEAEKSKESRKKKVVQKKSKGGKYSKAGVWRHNFFVAGGDERLKEAFAFLKKTEKISSEAFGEKRTKLKQVIKSKIRKARSERLRNEKFSKKRKV